MFQLSLQAAMLAAHVTRACRCWTHIRQCDLWVPGLDMPVQTMLGDSVAPESCNCHLY